MDPEDACRQNGRTELCRTSIYRNYQTNLKKNELKPWLNESWVIPPNSKAEFVCCMEQVLDIYQCPYDEKKPWVGFEESCKQLVKETREPISSQSGQLKRYDYQDERNGVANPFMFSSH